ncbi:hypothetical protein MTO96_004255 [Rhipicephalus appendiculatus]
MASSLHACGEATTVAGRPGRVAGAVCDVYFLLSPSALSRDGGVTPSPRYVQLAPREPPARASPLTAACRRRGPMRYTHACCSG